MRLGFLSSHLCRESHYRKIMTYRTQDVVDFVMPWDGVVTSWDFRLFLME